DTRRIRRELYEDVKLGPLAPTRGVDEKDRIARDAADFRYVQPPRAKNRIKNWNIVQGDRVVILAGKNRNRVGIVKELHKEQNALTVAGLNMVGHTDHAVLLSGWACD